MCLLACVVLLKFLYLPQNAQLLIVNTISRGTEDESEKTEKNRENMRVTLCVSSQVFKSLCLYSSNLYRYFSLGFVKKTIMRVRFNCLIPTSITQKTEHKRTEKYTTIHL